MKGDIGSINRAVVTGSLSVFGQQIVRLVIDHIETDGVEYVTGNGLGTQRISAKIRCCASF